MALFISLFEYSCPASGRELVAFLKNPDERTSFLCTQECLLGRTVFLFKPDFNQELYKDSPVIEVNDVIFTLPDNFHTKYNKIKKLDNRFITFQLNVATKKTGFCAYIQELDPEQLIVIRFGVIESCGGNECDGNHRAKTKNVNNKNRLTKCLTQTNRTKCDKKLSCKITVDLVQSWSKTPTSGKLEDRYKAYEKTNAVRSVIRSRDVMHLLVEDSYLLDMRNADENAEDLARHFEQMLQYIRSKQLGKIVVVGFGFAQKSTDYDEAEDGYGELKRVNVVRLIFPPGTENFPQLIRVPENHGIDRDILASLFEEGFDQPPETNFESNPYSPTPPTFPSYSNFPRQTPPAPQSSGYSGRNEGSMTPQTRTRYEDDFANWFTNVPGHVPRQRRDSGPRTDHSSSSSSSGDHDDNDQNDHVHASPSHTQYSTDEEPARFTHCISPSVPGTDGTLDEPFDTEDSPPQQGQQTRTGDELRRDQNLPGS